MLKKFKEFLSKTKFILVSIIGLISACFIGKKLYRKNQEITNSSENLGISKNISKVSKEIEQIDKKIGSLKEDTSVIDEKIKDIKEENSGLSDDELLEKAINRRKRLKK